MARLLSVNVGMPKDVSWHGRTVRTGVWKSQIVGPQMVRRLNIDGDGQGDVAASHVAWRFGKGAPSKPSILLVGDVIYMVNDGGIVGAVEAPGDERRAS